MKRKFLLHSLILICVSITGYAQDITVIIKFKDSFNIRVRNDSITDFNRNVLPIALKATLNNSKIKRLHEKVSEIELTKQHEVAEKNLGKQISDPNTYFTISIKDTIEYKRIIKQLKECDAIEYFEISQPSFNPLPGNFQSSQTYLNSSAGGINATTFWSNFNNRGTGIKVVDIEQGVNVNHADLPNITVLNTNFNNNSDNHGTAVCGEIASKNNGWGTTGIASDCSYYFAPVGSIEDIAAAIIQASTTINEGDFILIEQQLFGPNCNNCSHSNQVGMVPVEWDQACYNAIQLAVGNGRIVVEAAGNGSQDLDDAIYSTGHAPFLPQNNSGAIMVGAGASQNGSSTARSRLSFSNYGSRLDLQGIGENVMTTGYGAYYSNDGTNYFYTDGFSGTSSASPIVTGAGILVQSKYKETNGSVLSPTTLKDILITTGKAQQSGTNPVSQHIGPLPDVVAAYNSIPSTGDDCLQPTPLSSNISCVPVLGTVDGATDDGFPSIPVCDVYNNPDMFGVFFQFTAQSNTHTIDIDPTGVLDAVVVLYSGSDCFNLTEEDCEDTPGGNGGFTSLTYNNFVPGEQYWVRVYDYGLASTNGNGGFEICITHSPNLICETPSNLDQDNVDETEANLSWNNVVGALSYEIRYRENGGSWIYETTSSTTLFIDNLICNTDYEWGVRSNCSNDDSNWSSTQYFTTDPCNITCNTPTNATETSIGENNVTLDWSNVSGAVSYTLRYRVVGGPWQFLYPNNSSQTIPDLNCNTDYEWQVSTECNGSSSSYTTIREFTTDVCTNTCNLPGNLSSNVIGQNDVNLTWNVVSGAVGYTIFYRPAGGGGWTTDFTNNTNISITGLICSTQYEWVIQTDCGNTFSNSSNTQLFTTDVCASCEIPQNPHTNFVSQIHGVVEWDPVSGVNYYEVIHEEVGSGNPVLVTNFNQPAISIPNLACGTTHSWKVRAICSDGSTSPWTSLQYFTTNPCSNTCSEPQGLLTTEINSEDAVFLFSGVNNADGYEIRYREVGTSVWITDYQNGYNYWAQGLDCNITYEWQVRTDCGNGNLSNWTNSEIFTTENCTCNYSFNGYYFGFTCNGGSINFNIYAEQNCSWVISSTPGNCSWLTQNGSSYGSGNGSVQFTVAQNNNSFPNSCTLSVEGILIEFTQEAGPCECPAPNNLTSNSITEIGASLNWDDEIGAVGYLLTYRPVGSSQWTTIYSTNSSESLINLNCNTQYEWRIQTDCGTGGLSNSLGISSFTTNNCTNPCNYPDNRVTDNIGENSADLSWNYLNGYSNYELRYMEYVGGNWIYISTSNTSEFISNLDCNTHYAWQIRTDCNNGNFSGWSPFEEFWTQTCISPCATPTNLVETTILSDSVYFDWSDVPNTTSYRMQLRESGTTGWWEYTSQTSNKLLIDFQCNTWYDWRISTNCVNGSSNWSSIRTFKTLPDLNAPILIVPAYGATVWSYPFTNPSGNLINRVDFEWIRDTYDIEYRIQIDNNPGFSSPSHDAVTPYNSIYWWDFPNDGSTYYWQISRNTCGGWSEWAAFMFHMGTGTGIENLSDDYLKVYPNPSKGQFFIESDVKIIEYRIHNSLGQILQNEVVNKEIFKITINSPGVFIVEMITEQGTSVKRLIVY